MKLQTIVLSIAATETRAFALTGKNLVIGASAYGLAISFDSLNFFAATPGMSVRADFTRVWIRTTDTPGGEFPVTLYVSDFDFSYAPNFLGGKASTVFPAQTTYGTVETHVVPIGGTDTITLQPAAPAAALYQWLKQVKICNPHATQSLFLIDGSANNLARIAPGASETFETGGSIGGVTWTLSNPGAGLMTAGVYKTFYSNKVTFSQIATL